jgi:hypothetical protein
LPSHHRIGAGKFLIHGVGFQCHIELRSASGGSFQSRYSAQAGRHHQQSSGERPQSPLSIQAQLALDKKNPAGALNVLQADSSIEFGLIQFLNNISCLNNLVTWAQAVVLTGRF